MGTQHTGEIFQAVLIDENPPLDCVFLFHPSHFENGPDGYVSADLAGLLDAVGEVFGSIMDFFWD